MNKPTFGWNNPYGIPDQAEAAESAALEAVSIVNAFLERLENKSQIEAELVARLKAYNHQQLWAPLKAQSWMESWQYIDGLLLNHLPEALRIPGSDSTEDDRYSLEIIEFIKSKLPAFIYEYRHERMKAGLITAV